MSSVLAARGLTKRYGSFTAVHPLDLAVEQGEIYGFIGPNGAGKTTTIRMVLGLISPTAGSIEMFGEPLGPDRGALRRVGALVEEPAFWPYLSGRRNLEYFARAGGRTDDTRSRLRRIEEVLGTVGLAGVADRKVKAFSQGMRQRLGIAQALLGVPELLVLDEPTNGLDPTGMREVRSLVRGLADGGLSVLVSSHLLGEVESICDRVGVMAGGRLVAQGTPLALRGPSDRIVLDVGDVQRAIQLLAGLRGVEIVGDPAGTRLTLAIDGLSAADVNAAIVLGGVDVHAMIPVAASLDDAFHDLVKDDDVPR